MAKDSEAYTLYYWTRAEGVVGRTHGVLMCLEEAGVKYVVKDNTQMPSGTHCMAVPVVTLPDGSHISQQSAICAAIGKAHGLYPTKGFADELMAMNLAGNTTDLFSEALEGRDSRRIGKWLSTYEAALTAANSGYLVGDCLTYADLYAYQIVRYCAEKHAATVRLGPKLTAWLNMMAQTKGAQALEAQGKLSAQGVPMMPGGR